MNFTDTTPIADMLAHLNTLRVANGKKELSSWKNSRLELELRIQQEAPAPTHDLSGAALNEKPTLADEIAYLEQQKQEAPVTHVPASAPELTKPVKRKAAIDNMVDTAVNTDTPTTVIDIKAAGKKLNKREKRDQLKEGITKAFKNAKPATDKPAKVKAPKNTAPQGKGEFAIYLESINMEGRVARAKLRRAKIKLVDGRYPLNDAVKAALASDGRKKS